MCCLILFVFQANQNSLRHSNQKIAAYNLGVAQGVRESKNARNTEFIVSLWLHYLCFKVVHA